VARAGEDAKRIAELEGVEYSYYNVKPIGDQIELTFVVAERQVIRAIEFAGNRAFKSKELAGKLGFKVGDYLDPVLAETYTSTISEFYRTKGFAFIDVVLEREKLSGGMVSYLVEEGPRVRVSAVRFEGNSALKSGQLRKTIKTSPRSWLFWPRYYREEQVAEDLARLQGAYQRRGFLNADITARRQYNADRTKVRITFVIAEGAAYRVERVVFSGNEEFERERLISILELEAGQVFDQRKAELDSKHLVKLYRESGFIDAGVEQGLRFVSDQSVEVEHRIKEGQRFRIGQVTITGNEQTQDRVVRRILDEYDFRPGEWYNADIASGDGRGYLERRLQRMLLTERGGATITPVGQNADQRDARVDIIEGRTGMVLLGAGVTSDSGVIGQLVFEQRNFDIKDKPKGLMDFITGQAFRGGGQSLRVALQPGTELSEYSVSFSEPYLNDKPIGLDVVGSSWERWRESYDEGRTKGSIGLQKRYKDRWRRSVGFRVENVSVEDLDYDAPQEIRNVEGDSFLGGLRLGIGRDTTDDMFRPSKGNDFELGYEQVAGGHTFGIISGVWRRYATLHEDLAERKTVLSTKLLVGSVVSSAPPFEKFYAGGTGRYGIRGFEYRGVSTRGLQVISDPNATPRYKDPIGSDWLLLASAEVVVPLVSENFGVLFFADSGAIDSGGYRASVGAGIQILIPQWFGPVPMRFELAAPVMKDDEDVTQAFSFSIGRLF